MRVPEAGSHDVRIKATVKPLLGFSIVPHKVVCRLLQEKQATAAALEENLRDDCRPRDAEQFFELAEALKANGQLTKSIAAYREACKLEPKMANLRFNLANGLKDNGEYAEAIISYREACRLEPQLSPGMWAMLSQMLMLHGNGGADTEEALAAARQALAMEPNSSQLHGILSMALISGGRLSEAHAAALHVMRLFPNDEAVQSAAQQTLARIQEKTAALVGNRVELFGLSTVAMNGRIGLVQSWNVHKGRFQVKLKADEAGQARTLLVKCECCRPKG